MSTLASVATANPFSKPDANLLDWLIPYALAGGAIGVEVGDLMYDGGSDVALPAGQQATQGSLAADQVLFAANFCGVSTEKVLSSETNATRRIAVMTTGVKIFNCAATSWVKGDLVGIYSNGSDSPVSSQVAKVSTVDKAIGICIKSSLGVSVTTVEVLFIAKDFTGQNTTGTMVGDVVLDSIVGGDSSLAIEGQVGSASAGGAIAMAGGAGDGAGNAGGAITMAGGLGITTGAGGALTFTGGTGGAGGAGGAVSMIGGVPTSGNAAGGAATFKGGAGSGTSNGGVLALAGGAGGSTSGAGGAASLAGGAGGGTGAGGALTLAGGASGGGATGNGGAITVAGGAAASTNGTGGAASVAGGAATGTGTGGALTLAGGASAGAGGTSGAVTIDVGARNGGTGAQIKIGASAMTTLELGTTVGTENAEMKGFYKSGTIVVAVPTIADGESDEVAVDVSAMTFAPAVGDIVVAIPLEALPTDALLCGAYVSNTDQVTVSFGTKEGGSGVTGANKNFAFFFIDVT